MGIDTREAADAFFGTALASETRCPACGSDDVRGEIPEDPNLWRFAHYRCAECDEAWSE